MESPVLQKAAASQTSKENNGTSAANLAAVENIPEEAGSEDAENQSALSQNSPVQDAMIEISPAASGNSSESSDADSSTALAQSDDAVSSAASSSQSSSPSSQGSVSAGGGGGTGSSGGSGSPSSQGGAPAGGGGGAGGSGGGSGSSDTGNTDSPVVKQDDYPVFVLPSYRRVLQNEWTVTGDSSAEIYCAKNETESFQIVVVNKSSSTLPDIEITVSQWEPQRSTGRSPVLTLYREHYVEVKKSSYGIQSELGMYPDALIPFIDPYTNQPIYRARYLANHQSVSPKTSQGYWADVQVGSNVPAGSYTCSILVTSDDKPIAEIPVTLNVWNFTLPARRAWTAWFSMVTNLGKVYGLKENKGSDYDQLMSRHQDMLYENGVYPTLQAPQYPIVDEKTGAVTFDGYNRFLFNLKSFVAKYGPGVYRILDHFPNDFDRDGNNPKLAKTLYDFHRFQTAHPELGQFFYIIDEPYKDEAGRKVINVARMINQVAPSIKLFVNGAWFTYYTDPEVTEAAVEAAVDIRSLYSSYANKKEELKQIQKWINEDKPVWISPEEWLTDTEILNYRIPAWRCYSLGMTGIMIWRTSISDPDMNPWINPVTYTSGGNIWNGHGFLIYQGTTDRVGFSEQGPIASMRLKIFRDSVEDYAYFRLLESKIGKTQVVSMVSAIATDFTTHDNNSESYIAQRKAIAELILH